VYGEANVAAERQFSRWLDDHAWFRPTRDKNGRIGSRSPFVACEMPGRPPFADSESRGDSSTVVIFLCGDVMLGRGIDQVLATPSDPTLHEPIVRNAAEYVRLAEETNGPIPCPLPGAYLWGVALEEFHRVAPDVRIVNLETAVTTSNDYDRNKLIHYRMHPANIDALTSAGIHGCSVANNHVLDWGRAGLAETLQTLTAAGIAPAGAGQNLAAARRPAVFPLRRGGRLLLFACGSASAGVAAEWAATSDRSGVWQIDEGAPDAIDVVARTIASAKKPGDIAVLSIHWGDNWGYRIPAEQRRLAHGVIDEAGVDVVYGHSSHHVKGIEVYQGRPIFYGCGDFLTDYEGIPGYEGYRDDLGLMYFVTLDAASGRTRRIEMTPTQLKQFRLVTPDAKDVDWLTNTLSRECRRLGTSIELTKQRQLLVDVG
jgi:poly-gamma-glutamate synthesis protein (capsule biosynthesis protein)